MKLNGILGKGSGKLGSAIFAINGGSQIVREHNPRISNPKTQAQIEQRAKFKLLAQIAADLAPALFFKKKGLFNARNQFISANMPLCTYDNEEAQVSIPNLHLTPSNSYLPSVQATNRDDYYRCVLNKKPYTPIEGLFYIGVASERSEGSTSRLRVAGVEYETDAGVYGNYPHNSPWSKVDYVFAVGVKKIDGSKKIVYADYDMGDATGLAALGAFFNIKDITTYITQSRGAIAQNG